MRVLIAEDDPVSALVLRKALDKMGHETVVATNGAEAWRLFQEDAFPLVVSDWMMPEMNGLELCRRIRAHQTDSYVYVILLTAKGQREDKAEGLQAGADDFLVKPLDRGELMARVEVARRILAMQEELHRRTTELEQLHAQLEARVQERTAELATTNAALQDQIAERIRAEEALMHAYDATIEGWSRAMELRDQETEGHAQRVTEMTLRLAREVGISEAELVHIRRGALLHDIGKMGIPDGILLKPGKLTDIEWEIMRRHPLYAFEMLSPIAFLGPALDIPYSHHEKWDGTGYPRGLEGEQISLAARLFAMVDVWDALCSDRPYRQAWPLEKVCKYIRSLAGTHFDPNLVEIFLRILNRKRQNRPTLAQAA